MRSEGTELADRLTSGEVMAMLLGLSAGLAAYLALLLIYGLAWSYAAIFVGVCAGGAVQLATRSASVRSTQLAGLLSFVAVVTTTGWAYFEAGVELQPFGIGEVIALSLFAGLAAMVTASGSGLLGTLLLDRLEIDRIPRADRAALTGTIECLACGSLQTEPVDWPPLEESSVAMGCNACGHEWTVE